MTSRFQAYAPAAFWAAIVLYIGSRPNLTAPSFIIPLDKVGHFGMYGILGALAAHGWRRSGLPRAWVVPLLAVFLIGAGDELHQRVVPGRFASVLDWAADVTGAASGFLLVTRAMRNDTRSA